MDGDHFGAGTVQLLGGKRSPSARAFHVTPRGAPKLAAMGAFARFGQH